MYFYSTYKTFLDAFEAEHLDDGRQIHKYINWLFRDAGISNSI